MSKKLTTEEYKEVLVSIGSKPDRYPEELTNKDIADEVELSEPLVISSEPSNEEEQLKSVHENMAAVKEPEDEVIETSNPEDAAVLVNGKPLPIGEEVTV